MTEFTPKIRCVLSQNPSECGLQFNDRQLEYLRRVESSPFYAYLQWRIIVGRFTGSDFRDYYVRMHRTRLAREIVDKRKRCHRCTNCPVHMSLSS